MAGAQFDFDSDGSFFIYFLLAFEAFLIILCTYYYLLAPDEDSNCEKCSISKRQRQPWQKLTKFLIFGVWILFFWHAYKVFTQARQVDPFDPYKILDIPHGASLSEVKRAYRKLVLLRHPDKAYADEKEFIMLRKAYETLTVPEARRNFEMCQNNHQDCHTSFGIAFQASIVDEKNLMMVSGVYLLLIVLIPLGIIYAGCKAFSDTSAG